MSPYAQISHKSLLDLMNEALDDAAIAARRVSLQTKTPLIVSHQGRTIQAQVTRSLKLKFPSTKKAP